MKIDTFLNHLLAMARTDEALTTPVRDLPANVCANASGFRADVGIDPSGNIVTEDPSATDIPFPLPVDPQWCPFGWQEVAA